MIYDPAPFKRCTRCNKWIFKTNFGKDISRTDGLNSRCRACVREMTKDWLNCLEYFDYRCAVCGRPRGLWHTLAADHWIPLIAEDCPGTIPTNIVPLCQGIDGCNNRKNKSDPTKWLKQQFGKAKAKIILNNIQEYFKWVTEK